MKQMFPSVNFPPITLWQPQTEKDQKKDFGMANQPWRKRARSNGSPNLKNGLQAPRRWKVDYRFCKQHHYDLYTVYACICFFYMYSSAKWSHKIVAITDGKSLLKKMKQLLLGLTFDQKIDLIKVGWYRMQLSCRIATIQVIYSAFCSTSHVQHPLTSTARSTPKDPTSHKFLVIKLVDDGRSRWIKSIEFSSWVNHGETEFCW